MVQSEDDVEVEHSQIQLAISKCEDLLRIAGSAEGCLEPDKSSWYLVDYKWILGKWKCMNPGQEKVLEDTNKSG